MLIGCRLFATKSKFGALACIPQRTVIHKAQCDRSGLHHPNVLTFYGACLEATAVSFSYLRLVGVLKAEIHSITAVSCHEILPVWFYQQLSSEISDGESNNTCAFPISSAC